jgi:tetratricopeptide (TPR) repeat protein
MQEGYWESAVKNLNNAMSINRSQPDFHLALAECYLHLDRIKDAVIHFTQFIKARPKNVKGWKELIKCLYDAGYYSEALEQVHNAQKNTNGRPLFIFYKSAILFAQGKSKEALLHLHNGVQVAPSLVKQFIELNPSLLQIPSIAEVISANKNSRRYKGK